MAKSKSKKEKTSKVVNTPEELSKSNKKIVNIHDAFFKNTFSYPEIVKEYIAKFMEKDLVENIDLESLELEPTSYVTSELTEYFSDLVWNVKYKATNVKICLKMWTLVANN
jgi:Putative transposase, YhgA-like